MPLEQYCLCKKFWGFKNTPSCFLLNTQSIEYNRQTISFSFAISVILLIVIQKTQTDALIYGFNKAHIYYCWCFHLLFPIGSSHASKQIPTGRKLFPRIMQMTSVAVRVKGVDFLHGRPYAPDGVGLINRRESPYLVGGGTKQIPRFCVCVFIPLWNDFLMQ